MTGAGHSGPAYRPLGKEYPCRIPLLAGPAELFEFLQHPGNRCQELPLPFTHLSVDGPDPQGADKRA